MPSFLAPENHRLFEAGHNTNTVDWLTEREQGWVRWVWQTICKVRKEPLLAPLPQPGW